MEEEDPKRSLLLPGGRGTHQELPAWCPVRAVTEVVGGVSVPSALVPAVASPGEVDFPVRPAGR